MLAITAGLLALSSSPTGGELRAWTADVEHFSASRNCVTLLERDTGALLVGEPTGGAPNQYGDARPVTLPNHQAVLVRRSTRSFATRDDPRVTYEPDLLVPLTSADYFAGRDSVLRWWVAEK